MATDDKPQTCELEMGYQTTVMYGRYTRSLGEYAREQAAELRQMQKNHKREEKIRNKELRSYQGKWTSRFFRLISFLWRHTFAKIGEDWVFLALLGSIMALLSYIMDYGVSLCNTARMWMYFELATHPTERYLAWICLPVFLVLFSAGFVYLVAPQAIGSGIPEMKTILRGVVLKEYLTFRTGVAKIVALTAALGSGMPLGKEGPLVHIASIVATLMSKLVTSFKGIYENESRNSEMLAAACAVGVSCNFAAPIGGVLFSIEVTSVYFAIRNYWRGFFSAVFGALMFRLLAYWFETEETLTAMFRTDFRVDFPYDPHELFIYALIGAFGGLSGALFVLCHRKYVLFMRKNKRISAFLQKNRFIYPAVVSLFIATLYFPPGLGQFLVSTLTTRQQIMSLFSNFTWMGDDLTAEQSEIVSHWTNEYSNLFVTLGIYMATTFFLTVLASTLPVPSGSLIPIFKIGAAFGRIIGEAMHLWFPEGIRIGSIISPVLPGGYAIVGAAAFSAGVTHSISICVVVSEMTGQIQHIIPVLVAVLVSNAISTLLQPSLYDSIIMIKKLPYLPGIISSSSAAYEIFVEDFMNRNIKYIWNGMTFAELKAVIRERQKIRSFPLVDNPRNMVLLGSIQRGELIELVKRHVGHERRMKVAAQRQIEIQARSCGHVIPINLDPPPCRLDKKKESPTQDCNKQQTSRFEVVKATDDLGSGSTEIAIQRSSHQLQQLQLITLLPLPEPQTPVSIQSTETDEETQPRKSILKKINRFGSGLPTSSQQAIHTTPTSTITEAEGSKFRQAIGAFIRKSTANGGIFNFSIAATSAPNSPNLFKNAGATNKSIDMTPEEKKEWEESEMLKPVDFHMCHVDPAPFQLVERTSLLKVHSMFSLLGVNRAYVTTIGRLIGIVSLSELRKAIEDVNSGVSLAFHRYSFSSQGDNSEFDLQGVSPGAPKDLETGPDLPGVSDSDSETDQDESPSSAFVIPVQFDVHQLPAVSVNVENTASTILPQDNSIKLIVPSGFACPSRTGESSNTNSN
ncbi:Chloride channel protein 2 [Daphnia magna]|uniref:Chloride channel protein n=1 Tax=Daphnia magna TaxID=35525 RepID=A0A164NL37_9CRUS|nr:Chloride channel protein 2 [Daphnia magna]